jgi:hypothetical protein
MTSELCAASEHRLPIARMDGTGADEIAECALGARLRRSNGVAHQRDHCIDIDGHVFALFNSIRSACR